MSTVELHTRLTPPEMLERLPAGPGRFLLESQGGPADITRYSYLGAHPHLRLVSRGRQVRLEGEGWAQELDADPLAVLDRVLAEQRCPVQAGLPPFQGGAVGCFAYDLGRLLERVPGTAANDLDVPDICLGFYRTVIAVDHEAGRAWAIGPEAADWSARLEAEPGDASREMPPPEALQGQLRSNFEPEAYRAVVQRAIEYILAGDIFQVNLSQRFTAPAPQGGWALYRRLRAVNPAPFAAYLHCGSFEVASASPERFLQVEAAGGASHGPTDFRRVETRPIKGTRPRGRTPAEEAAHTAALLSSEKDLAELNMIIDLERNDLGRVCRTGTVRVPDRRRLEAYPTVLHTVATVTGELRPEVSAGDLLRAAFPGGSITGAPKVRAMEIIEELEGLRRGIYCGSVGWLGFGGGMDLNLAIRTVVVRDGQAYFHAGGGIVADSDPQAEYAETLDKARGLVRALGLPEPGE